MSASNKSESCDYFGSWVLHTFNSEKKILEKTKSVGCVKRMLSTHTVNQDFRHYRNGNGQSRYLMMTDGTREDFRGNYPAWITNYGFFREFCKGMLACGEITEDEYRKLKENSEKFEEEKENA